MVLSVFVVLVALTVLVESTTFRYSQITWNQLSGYTVQFTVKLVWRSTFIYQRHFEFGDGSSTLMGNDQCPTLITPCPSDTSSKLYYQKIYDKSDLNDEDYTLIMYIFNHTYSTSGPYTVGFSGWYVTYYNY